MLASISRIFELERVTDTEKHAEEYAVALGEAFGEYYEDVTALHDILAMKVKEAVRNRDVEGFIRLVSDCYADEQYLIAYNSLKEIADICKTERDAGEKNTLLEASEDIEEVLRLFRELKYLFLRIQLIGLSSDKKFSFFQSGIDDAKCDKKYICDLVISNNISRSALDYFLERCTLDRFSVAKYLADVFMDESRLSYALHMYRRCNELDEGREDVLVPMANIYHICDRDSIAVKCLDAISDPSDRIKDLHITYSQRA
ncbi:MAG: hypothetical protein IK123_12015 [Lachnospiraceae bacterium]|nr:hypothetical protein [Lachnospiraceae bacterium]